VTWSINFGGHLDDRSKEQLVADVGAKVVEELKTLGLTTARMTGNQVSVDYLAPPAVEEAAADEGEGDTNG
jgi:hypothetical protein